MIMVSRRGLLGGAAAMATVILGGCGRDRTALVTAAKEAASGVEGVASVELEMADGANFEQLLRGTVALEAKDRDSGLLVFDEAMRSIITVIYEELDEVDATSLRVGWITGVLAGGEEITPMELDPYMPAVNPRRDRITAESFYTKYGLG
ncbi:hypothetical protein CFK39_12920 [Brachybacterium avium]|uniref:Uncharacterized protein n=2 Tax=Brachybacterium avium TaxID=2017485 RepID=A0A220UEJ6_9MICO|nr:hypothetical protein CFK39_12920 [Brachybacterium avium]